MKALFSSWKRVRKENSHRCFGADMKVNLLNDTNDNYRQ
jgi:hypothetical protein